MLLVQSLLVQESLQWEPLQVKLSKDSKWIPEQFLKYILGYFLYILISSNKSALYPAEQVSEVILTTWHFEANFALISEKNSHLSYFYWCSLYAYLICQ